MFVFALMLLGGFFAAITPPLARQTVKLAQEVPDFADRLSDRSTRFGELDERFKIAERVREAVNNLPQLAAGSTGRALGVVRSVGSTVFSIVTVIVLTIYFLLDLPKLDRRRREAVREDAPREAPGTRDRCVRLDQQLHHRQPRDIGSSPA